MYAFRDCHRAPGRLCDGERPVLRQQRLAGRLRHDRPAGGLPGGQGGDDEAAAPRAAGRDAQNPSICSSSTPDGTEVDGSFLVMVSNNPYVLAASPEHVPAPPSRHGAARCVRRDGDDGRTGGRGRHPGPGRPGGAQRPCLRVQLRERSRSGPAPARRIAGVDGEALELETPMTFRSHPQGLRMLVPEGNIEIALERQSRGVHLHDLVLLAKGTAARLSSESRSAPRDPMRRLSVVALLLAEAAAIAATMRSAHPVVSTALARTISTLGATGMAFASYLDRFLIGLQLLAWILAACFMADSTFACMSETATTTSPA